MEESPVRQPTSASRPGWILVALVVLVACDPRECWAQPAPPDLRAIVVVRESASGHSDLKVDETWLRGHRTPVLVQVETVCRYNPAQDRWQALPPTDQHRLQRLAPLTPAQSTHGVRVAYESPRDIALLWVRWSEQHEDNRAPSRVRGRSAYLFSGPILCNDLMLGPAPNGLVAACVPFANRAEARLVPDPATACATPRSKR